MCPGTRGSVPAACTLALPSVRVKRLTRLQMIPQNISNSAPQARVTCGHSHYHRKRPLWTSRQLSREWVVRAYSHYEVRDQSSCFLSWHIQLQVTYLPSLCGRLSPDGVPHRHRLLCMHPCFSPLESSLNMLLPPHCPPLSGRRTWRERASPTSLA